MHCPILRDLPPPPPEKTGWPWTEETPSDGADTIHCPLPRISLVTPNYNGGAFLEECIRSVLLQGYPDLEYVVIDGGSTDNSVEIIRKYAPWLSYWESQEDRGQSHAINKGLAKSTGKYFNWHNADDVLLPGSLFETVAGFERHPDALYISRTRLLMDESGRVFSKPYTPEPGLIDLRKSLIVTSPGSQPGGLLDREQVVAAGAVDETLHSCMDEDLLLRLRLKGPGYYVEKPGFIFRTHKHQKSQALTPQRVREKFIISKKIFSLLPPEDPLRALQPEARIFAHRHGARLYREAGQRLPALGHACVASILNWKLVRRPAPSQAAGNCP